MVLKASPPEAGEVLQEETAFPSVQTRVGNSYENIYVTGSGRQLMGDEYHGPVMNGNINGPVHHGDVNNYLMRQRAAEQVARTNKALLKAAATGQLKRVQQYLDKGADPEYADESGLTALHYASLGGFSDVVATLLALDVDTEASSDIFGTPLCLAARKLHYIVVKALLDHGAEADGEGGLLGSPLHAACFAGNHNIAITKLLLNSGSSPNLCRPVSWEALRATPSVGSASSTTYAVSVQCDPLAVAAKGDHCTVVNHLLAQGASVNAKCEGYTALMWAATYASSTTVSALLDRGADTSVRSPAGLTAFLCAAKSNSSKVVKVLQAKSSREDKVDSESGRNALMIAAMEGNVDVMYFLVESGTPIDARDNESWTALALAVGSEQPGSVDSLTALGADIRQAPPTTLPLQARGLLAIAASKGSVTCTEALLRRGALNQTIDSAKGIALHVAAEQGHTEIAELLVNAGLDPNIRETDDGYTPLMTAALNNRIETARKLLELGANAKLKSSKGGHRANDIAVWRGYNELGNILANAAGASAELDYLIARGFMKLHRMNLA